MVWGELSWTERFNAVASVYGTTNSDCGADELLHLWDTIRTRGLEDVYITHLAALLNITSYTPAEIMRMMTASDAQYHWPAALRAAGVEVTL